VRVYEVAFGLDNFLMHRFFRIACAAGEVPGVTRRLRMKSCLRNQRNSSGMHFRCPLKLALLWLTLCWRAWTTFRSTMTRKLRGGKRSIVVYRKLTVEP
jgi:hypothetical protein